jgi:hypothetical protein
MDRSAPKGASEIATAKCDLPEEYLRIRAALPKTKVRRTSVGHAYPKPSLRPVRQPHAVGLDVDHLAQVVADRVVEQLVGVS